VRQHQGRGWVVRTLLMGGVAAGLIGSAEGLASGRGATPPPSGFAFHDGPPARVTGGFSEDSCAACHREWEANEGPGGLRLIGLPDEIIPGSRIPLTVELVHGGMARSGFQMAVRWAESGEQAGVLVPAPSEADRVAQVESRMIHFVQHKALGTDVVAPDTARWNVEWVVPSASPERPISSWTIHIAAVAADGDESQMGDYPYTLERSGSVAVSPPCWAGFHCHGGISGLFGRSPR